VDIESTLIVRILGSEISMVFNGTSLILLEVSRV
jgi:hypothetical protein